MKRPGKLAALVLAGLLSVAPISGYEKNMFKYIPEGSSVVTYDLGIMYMFYWDKNKNELLEQDELFFDFNRDGIPDISFIELRKMYEANEGFRDNKFI